MARVSTWSTLGLSMGLAATLLTGCSHASAPRALSHVQTAPTLSAPSSAPATMLDSRTCAGVESTVKHLTVSTVRWSPTRDPFDRAISAQIGLLSSALYRQAPQAGTLRVRLVIAGNARAFAAVAQAMHGRSKSEVTRTISATRVAYRGLKQACSLQ